MIRDIASLDSYNGGKYKQLLTRRWKLDIKQARSELKYGMEIPVIFRTMLNLLSIDKTIFESFV